MIGEIDLRWGALMTTLAVVYDAFLVTFRYLEERRLVKKLQKAESSDFAKNNAGDHLSQLVSNIVCDNVYWN